MNIKGRFMDGSISIVFYFENNIINQHPANIQKAIRLDYEFQLKFVRKTKLCIFKQSIE